MNINLKPIIVFLAIAFVTFIWGWYSTETNPWNTAFVLGTGLVLLYYTYETYRLRTEAQKTNELNQTPSILLMISVHVSSTLFIKNVNKNNIAYNVSIESIWLDKETEYRLELATVNNFLEPESVYQINITKYKYEPGSITREESSSNLGQLVLVSTFLKKDFIILVKYTNVLGQKYYVINRLKISAKKPELVFIANNKGLITYNEAEKIAGLI